MPDWRRLVRERLPPLALPGPRDEEIHEELAQQLEQSYDDARMAGARRRGTPAGRGAGDSPRRNAVCRGG